MKIIPWDDLHSQETQSYFQNITQKKTGTAVTIGGFDGPHIGHSALFSAVLEQSHSHNLLPGIITFTRSPKSTKNKDNFSGDVSSLRLRLKRISDRGFQFVILIDFSLNFSTITGEDFFDILVKYVHLKYLAVGSNFRCGYRLDTGIKEISVYSKRKCFGFDSIDQIVASGARVSSSAIRLAIQVADFSLAKTFLGYPFLLDISTQQWIQYDTFFETSIESILQILPPKGSYKVILHLDTESTISCFLEVLDKTIRIVFKNGEIVNGNLDTLEFC